MRGCARARSRRDRARAGDRAHAAGGRPLPRPLRRARRAAPFGADGSRAARRAAADRGRRRTHRRWCALRDLRARPRARADLRRRGARSVVQAGVGSALRRADRRGEACLARARRRRLRQRNAAAGELGGARTHRPRRAHHRKAAACACSRPTAGGRLPALRSAVAGTRTGRDARRKGDPAPEPARRCTGAALPCVRRDDPLREL